MMALVLRWLGVGGVIAALILAFYEGVPYASRVPLLRDIPLVAGYRHTYAADQVKLATEGMVAKYKYDALQAQYEREHALRNAADKAAETAQAAKVASDKLAAQRQEELQAALKAAQDFPMPTEGELKWLENQRR